MRITCKQILLTSRDTNLDREEFISLIWSNPTKQTFLEAMYDLMDIVDNDV